MDKRSKYLFIAIGIVALISFVALYIRLYVRQDFNLYAYVDCDPSVESCFIYECDPAYDDWCVEEPQDPKENIWPYKFFFKSAKDTPKPEDANCDPVNAQDCPPIECAAGDASCEITCDPATDGPDACIGPNEAFFSEQAAVAEEEAAQEVADEATDEDVSLPAGEENTIPNEE